MLNPTVYHKTLKNHQHRFQDLFGVHMTFYLKPIVGFRLDMFEKDFKVPDNMSIRSFVREEYGSDAVNLIEYLIKL
jgi:hypothetical protein